VPKKQENELAELSKTLWGDNAPEFLVGALSSVVTESQLDALIAKLYEEHKSFIQKEQD
jgi:hypothetical protein